MARWNWVFTDSDDGLLPISSSAISQRAPMLLPYMMDNHHSLRWRHNGCNNVSNHQPHHCLLNRLFRRRSKKTSKLRVTGFCAKNSPGTGEFSAQMASNAENVSIWWRHYVYTHFCYHCNIFDRGQWVNDISLIYCLWSIYQIPLILSGFIALHITLVDFCAICIFANMPQILMSCYECWCLISTDMVRIVIRNGSICFLHSIESTKNTSMEDVSTGVLEKIKNI